MDQGLAERIRTSEQKIVRAKRDQAELLKLAKRSCTWPEIAKALWPGWERLTKEERRRSAERARARGADDRERREYQKKKRQGGMK